MRVLLANKFFFRNGGSETVMFQERDYLLSNGHEVIDFSMDDSRNFDSPYKTYFVGNQDYRGPQGKLASIRTAVQFIHSGEAAEKMYALVRKTRPDIVHCHNIYHQLTPSIIGAAKEGGAKVVLTLHDYKPVCPVYNRLRQDAPCSDCLDGRFSNVLRHKCAGGSLGKSALLFAEAVVQRWMGNYEKVDAFIAPSRFMAESIAHRVPDSRTRLLYNGVDLDALQPSTADAGYVLYLGRLSAEKGVATLLKAHANSQAKWPLHIAGTGPLEEVLKQQFPLATFLGHVSGGQLKQVMDGASVVVVPSEWYENCPMSVLEAMAYGKPVVGSRMGGIPELVVDGQTGLLFDAGDTYSLQAQLDRLMSEPDLRRRLGEQARQRVESEFSLGRHNTCLIDIYKKLIGG